MRSELHQRTVQFFQENGPVMCETVIIWTPSGRSIVRAEEASALSVLYYSELDCFDASDGTEGFVLDLSADDYTRVSLIVINEDGSRRGVYYLEGDAE